MKLAKIVVNDFGGAPFADHNMPCFICGIEPAVYNLNTGIFEPCWKCQGKGWRIVRRSTSFRDWLKKIFW